MVREWPSIPWKFDDGTAAEQSKKAAALRPLETQASFFSESSLFYAETLSQLDIEHLKRNCQARGPNICGTSQSRR